MILAEELLSIVKNTKEYSYGEVESLLREAANRGLREIYLYDKLLPCSVIEELKNEGIEVLDKSGAVDNYHYFVSF